MRLTSQSAGTFGPRFVPHLIFGVGLFIVASASSTQAQGLAWKKDWNVRCTWLDHLTLEQFAKWFHELVLKVPPEVARELGDTFADFQCDDDEPTSLAHFTRREFRGSSHWLKNLGFPDPIVTAAPDSRKYLAWLDIYKFHHLDPTSGSVLLEANGSYHEEGEIFVSPSMVYPGSNVEAHEQFHGVQHRAVGERFREFRDGDRWIWEGTARAEDIVWGKKTGHGFSLESRPHDRSLTKSAYRYGTAAYWLDVGRQLKSRDRIAYIDDLLSAITETGDSLKIVDKKLASELQKRGIDAGGLAHSLPEFVRYSLVNPNRVDLFSSIPEVNISLPPGSSSETMRVTHSVEHNAAEPFLIRALVPPSKVASLRIEIVDQMPSLHLVVDDRRYNREPAERDVHGKRNRFATIVSGSDDPMAFWVRVVNAASPADRNSRPFVLDVTLTLDSASATASGAESVRLNQGVHFSYVNLARDAREMARSAQEALIARSADHAGISSESVAGRRARDQISAATQTVFGPRTTAPAPGAGWSSVTSGSECLAVMTVFDDSQRSVAKLQWRGQGPLIGATHDVQATFATDLHDAVYNEYKRLGQELTLIENPEALAQWVEGLGNLTVPAFSDLMRQAGEAATAAAADRVRDSVVKRIPFRRARERLGVKRSASNELGRIYEGSGSMSVASSPGDLIEATYQFSAKDGDTGRHVQVSGEFTAVPGPLSNDNIWRGCETLFLAAEDNGDIQFEPPFYPPPLDPREDPKKRKPWPIPIPFTWPCFPNWSTSNKTLESDWTLSRIESDGTQVFERRWKETPGILSPPGPFGDTSRCRPKFSKEERRVPPKDGPQPCIPGPESTWAVEPLGDWTKVHNGAAEYWERKVRKTPSIQQPATQGGDQSRCQAIEVLERLPVPPDDPNDDSDASKDCVPGARSQWSRQVLIDWHEVEVGGITATQRVVRLTPTIKRPPKGNGSWLPCQPQTVTEQRPVRPPTPTDPPGGSPPEDPGSNPADPKQPPRPPVQPPVDDSEPAQRRPLVLDFLETSASSISSAPQPVLGSASAGSVSLAAGTFQLAIDLSSSSLSQCSPEFKLAARALASGRAITGSLQLDAAVQRLSLRLDTGQGALVISGPVSLSAEALGVRGNATRANLSISANSHTLECAQVLDLAFTATHQ